MDDLSATLLLTRPKPQSEAFLAECEAEMGRRLPVVISPLLKIEPVGKIPKLDAYNTIILTSGNGVLRLGRALAGRSVLTVGERTAALARQQGATATALGENVETFLEDTKLSGRVLFCRGVHSRGDLANRLREKGTDVEEAVIYDQVEQPLSEAAQNLLVGEGLVVAPVFSPRTAKLLSANRISSRLIMLAISPTVAEVWAGPGEVRIAKFPDAAHMRRLVQAAF